MPTDIMIQPQHSAEWRKLFTARIHPRTSIANMIPQWNGCIAEILANVALSSMEDTIFVQQVGTIHTANGCMAPDGFFIQSDRNVPVEIKFHRAGPSHSSDFYKTYKKAIVQATTVARRTGATQMAIVIITN